MKSLKEGYHRINRHMGGTDFLFCYLTFFFTPAISTFNASIGAKVKMDGSLMSTNFGDLIFILFLAILSLERNSHLANDFLDS